jgi:AraC-like DNA-binding protein
MPAASKALSMNPPRPSAPEAEGWRGREQPFWRRAGADWRQLAGNFRDSGFSFEWHEWHAPVALDWAGSFHPGSLEICLNLEGTAWVGMGDSRITFAPCTAGFFAVKGPEIRGERAGGERHKFLSVEFSLDFLKQRLGRDPEQLHPVIRQCLTCEFKACAGLSSTTPITPRQRDLLASLLHPPVLKAAQRLWYESKALEFAAEFFYCDSGVELLCTRAQRLAVDRVNKTKEILGLNLAEPLSLEELGRRVGCSHFYLSRTFTRETGLTISQWIRDARLERAADLLRAGKCNVTEAAMEVGYSSLSHFSQAFHERFGCCPGLYPLKTRAQQEHQMGVAQAMRPPNAGDEGQRAGRGKA